MADSVSVSLRLESGVQSDLEQMSHETGIPMSTLMRMAIEAAVKAYRENGRRIEVPLRFIVPYRNPEDPSSQMVAEDPS